MIVQDMTWKHWQHVFGSKIQGTTDLHELLPPKLDFLIMLFSGVGIVGVVGQANCATASPFQDAFAYYRISKGFVGIILDLGRMEGASSVAKSPEAIRFLERHGSNRGIKCDELTAILDYEIASSAQTRKAHDRSLAARPRLEGDRLARCRDSGGCPRWELCVFSPPAGSPAGSGKRHNWGRPLQHSFRSDNGIEECQVWKTRITEYAGPSATNSQDR